jgi:hypothetical protein
LKNALTTAKKLGITVDDIFRNSRPVSDRMNMMKYNQIIAHYKSLLNITGGLVNMALIYKIYILQRQSKFKLINVYMSKSEH